MKRTYASALVALFFFAATPAFAQATRTWVSGVGDDVNPCSRTAPCKTFAGAISKTAAGGEINCLDPGGYGAVTITKSITIDCEDTQGSILASATNGVTVNDSASGFPNTIRVILRGLSINGAQGVAQNASGNPGSGLIGVNFTSGASLTIEDCIIQNFNAGATASGVRVATNGAAQLTILNSHIVSNSAAGIGAGVLIQPAAGGTARVTITHTDFVRNTNAGVRVETGSTVAAAGVNVTLSQVDIETSTVGIAVNAPAGFALGTVMVGDSAIANNTQFGIQANGSGARVRVGGSEIANNGTAASATAGATVGSYHTNQINGNTTSDGTFSVENPA